MILMRNSNIELLRIFSMLFIVFFHFMGRLNIAGRYDNILDEVLYILFSSWGILGVNIFVVISAYYLYNGAFKSQKVLYLLFQVIFFTSLFTIISLIKSIYVNEEGLFINKEINRFFDPFWCKEYWFVTAYIFMYMLAPFINSFVKHRLTSSKQIIILFAFVPIIQNFMIDNNQLNPICDIVKFLWIYLMACYYKCGKILVYKTKTKMISLIFLLVFFILTRVILDWGWVEETTFLYSFLESTFGNHYRYSLLLAVASFLMVDLCLRIPKFFNSTINNLSIGVFGVYLFHENATVSIATVLAHKINEEFCNDVPISFAILTAIGLFLISYVFSMIFTKIYDSVIWRYAYARIVMFCGVVDDFYKRAI